MKAENDKKNKRTSVTMTNEEAYEVVGFGSEYFDEIYYISPFVYTSDVAVTAVHFVLTFCTIYGKIYYV